MTRLVPRGKDTDDYKDTGCDFSVSCFTCPLAQCKHDHPPGRQAKLMDRDTEIVHLSSVEGWRPMRIADHVGVSKRTVQRVVEREKVVMP